MKLDFNTNFELWKITRQKSVYQWITVFSGPCVGRKNCFSLR